MILLFTVVAVGQTTPAPTPAPKIPPPFPREPGIFAPYIDLPKTTLSLSQIKAVSGIRMFTLAFIQSVNGCAPGWGGEKPVADDTAVLANINELRANGGDVIIAFGGYDGTDLAQACPDAAGQQAAYQQVIDKYKAKYLDFDVEHLAIEDPASIDRRSVALKALAAANPGVAIHYTLPTNPAGLTKEAMYVIKSAVDNGTPVSVVNAMTMDYSYPVPMGAMGVNAVACISATAAQLKMLGLKDAQLGITPMIGTNDTVTETFTLQDALDVLMYAKANRNIRLLSFWSVGRDNGTCVAAVSPTCSGVSQSSYDFAHIFQLIEK